MPSCRGTMPHPPRCRRANRELRVDGGTMIRDDDIMFKPQRQSSAAWDGNAARGAETQRAKLDRRSQDQIGQRLRAMYDALIEEPVPAHLASLIGQLDERHGGRSQ